jgi:exonuclease SbcD
MARLFHTSDWHVGKSLRGLSRTLDHQAVLAEIVAQARDAEPDLIIHSGDVFDGVRPATGDLQLALGALNELGAIAQTVVLAGNHDSGALFDVFAMLLGLSSRVRFVSKARAAADGGIVEVQASDGTRLRLAPVPFVHANRQVDWFGDPQRFMAVYATRMQLINDIMWEGLQDGYDPARDVLLYAAHLHVSGAHLSGSERLVHVSETYAAESAGLPMVSYSALGHIHKPQQVPGRDAYYVGSPMQLDYGEAGEVKSSIVVDVLPGRPAEVQRLPLTAGRALQELRGSFEQIVACAPQVGNELLRVVIESEDPILDLADALTDLFPQATLVEVDERIASRTLKALDPSEAEDEVPEPTYQELLELYLQGTVTGDKTVPAAEVQKLFSALHDSLHDEDDPPVEQLAEIMDASLPTPQEITS